jgi:hypothetical protein
MEDIKKVALDRKAADAEEVLEIRKRHKEAIAQGRQLVTTLLDELTLAGGEPAMFDELETLLDQSNFEIESKIRKDKLMAIYLKVISLPARVKALNDLTGMLKILHRLETQAQGVNKSTPATDRIDACLAEIGRMAREKRDSVSEPVSKEEA